MPLGEPPNAAGYLASFPSEPVAGLRLWRAWRATTDRPDPWWYSSLPMSDGRYDLASPMGSCYMATTAVGAVLEALQVYLRSLPRAELRPRRIARIESPDNAPKAADVTDRQAVGRFGLTAALWAGTDHGPGQRWAAALRRDGWWALHSGLQHDPSGSLRGVVLFDHEGTHLPTTGEPWRWSSEPLGEASWIERELADFGVVIRDPGELPFVGPPG